jgi:cobalt-zinc-cadmium efflux system outer membrane protein
MRLVKVQFLVLVLAACVPSRGAVFGPVDREVERRVGVRPTWHDHADPRVPSAIAALLEQPLDRDACVKIALVANRRLQAQYDTLGIAAADVASATVLRPTEVDLETKIASGSIHEVELDVTQDILDLIQIGQRRGIAQADLAAARARAVAATVLLVAQVERAYIDMVAAQQELELRQTAFDAASASAEVADRQHAAGNISDVVVFRQRDQREQARIDLARAQVDVATTRAALDDVLGLGESKWTVANRLPEPPDAAPALDALETSAVTASLDLEALRADRDAATGRRGIARVRTILPELGVGVSAHRDEDKHWDAGPAISIGIPLFNQQQGPRARANAEIKRARNEALATETELRAQARAVRQRVLGTYAEVRALRDVIVPQRQRIVEETLKHYNAMNASVAELLLARRELVDGGRQYIDALRRFWRASADARALARGALPDPVGEPRMSTPATTSEGH